MICLILDPFNISKIAQLGRVILRQEDVQRFDISVDHVPRVQVVHTEANMNEYFPEEVVREELAFLFLYRGVEVTMLAMFHDDTNGLLSNKTVIVTNDEMTINLCHDLNL